ncbi:MAG: DUF1540 domain-containing protein [Firmicutes bacterium]|nr:DUF1540 domain-containing protein [Bacillota bacterium]
MRINTDTFDSTGTSWSGGTDPTGDIGAATGWQSDGTLPDVACGVTSCKYHSGSNHCAAKGINVQNENAHQKADTFCSTFVSKSM